MAETQQTEPTRPVAPPLQTGGLVMAIVPQSFPEIQKIAVQIITAGVAPASLIKWPAADAEPAEIEAIGKRNVAAVATCIMAGAELGLPPMVSLRAFTVINGKPALYADGNVAVVRKAKTPEGERVAEYLKTGYTEVRDYICPVCKGTFTSENEVNTHMIVDHAEQWDRLMLSGMRVAFARTEPTDKSHAWCEAKRRDNGEIYMETFSIEDAKRAGLWEGDKQFKRAKVWRNNKLDWHDDVPNDSPWFRYWKRMLMWRAVGYCLRWLFADVLGGMADEYEAREIDGMIDVTPPTQPDRPQRITARNVPEVPGDEPQPSPPTDAKATTGESSGERDPGGGDFNDDDSGVVIEGEASVSAQQKSPHDQTASETMEESAPADRKVSHRDAASNDDGFENGRDHPADVAFVPTGEITPEVQSQLEQLEGALLLAGDEPTLEEAFDEFDPQTKFADNQVATARAFQIKADALTRLHTKARQQIEAAGQGSMFDIPEVPN